MSWSVSIVGTKAAVAKKAAEAFDAAAKNYEGKEEAKDVLAAKERALVALAEAPANGGNGVSVEANGSRSTGYVSMNVLVKGVYLALDEPTPST